MIIVWSLLFVGYIVCATLIVPRSTIERYKAAPKDWQYWTAHLLFYSIPASWFLGVEQSSLHFVLTGIALFTTGSALNIWAMASNPYFSPVIEMPQKVIADGAYRWLSHPFYCGASAMAAGSWLMVGHSLAVIPLTAYVALLCRRYLVENRLLKLV